MLSIIHYHLSIPIKLEGGTQQNTSNLIGLPFIKHLLYITIHHASSIGVLISSLYLCTWIIVM